MTVAGDDGITNRPIGQPAPALLARIAWRGRAPTGGALSCQRHPRRRAPAAGGDERPAVEESQPALPRASELPFDPPGAARPPALDDRRAARAVERGHGRRGAARHPIASPDLTGYLDWPAGGAAGPAASV